MSDPRVVDLSTFNTRRSNFQAHYFLSNCNTSFGGQDFGVNWDDFATLVNSFATDNNISISDVALRFVLCYDATANVLFLRVQICSMTASGTPGTYNLVTTPSAWFALKNGSITTTTDTSLSDSTYMNNFYYCGTTPCSSGSSELLANNTIYVKNLVFPWESEILAMYQDNSSPSSATLNFAATSYVRASGTDVQYPHDLVLYLKNSSGTALLDNTTYAATFENKGADYGTMCPSYCNVYISA